MARKKKISKKDSDQIVMAGCFHIGTNTEYRQKRIFGVGSLFTFLNHDTWQKQVTKKRS